MDNDIGKCAQDCEQKVSDLRGLEVEINSLLKNTIDLSDLANEVKCYVKFGEVRPVESVESNMVRPLGENRYKESMKVMSDIRDNLQVIRRELIDIRELVE